MQICKDKKTTLLESMDKVKLSYSQLTAQTAELTQQVLHMTSHVRSQVRLLIIFSDESLDCVYKTAIRATLRPTFAVYLFSFYFHYCICVLVMLDIVQKCCSCVFCR